MTVNAITDKMVSLQSKYKLQQFTLHSYEDYKLEKCPWIQIQNERFASYLMYILLYLITTPTTKTNVICAYIMLVFRKSCVWLDFQILLGKHWT